MLSCGVCQTLLPDQGSGCHDLPSMIDFLSNHKPKLTFSPHLRGDGCMVTTVRKATDPAFLPVSSGLTQFHEACSHQNCHQSLVLDLSFLCPAPIYTQTLNGFPGDQPVRFGQGSTAPHPTAFGQNPKSSSNITTTAGM